MRCMYVRPGRDRDEREEDFGLRQGMEKKLHMSAQHTEHVVHEVKNK